MKQPDQRSKTEGGNNVNRCITWVNTRLKWTRYAWDKCNK